MAMTAVVERKDHAEAVSVPAPAASIAAIKATLAGVWPPVMIALGVVLTLLWDGGLLWLLERTILALT
jgi:hypothetical protein